MYTVVIKRDDKVTTEEFETFEEARGRVIDLEFEFEKPLLVVVLDDKFNMVAYEDKDAWENAFKPTSKVKEWKKFKPKSCIYCGSKGVLRYAYFGQWRGYQFRVECENPECTGDPPEFSTTPEEAIELWNYKR